MIRTDATCQALSSLNPSFMMTKELPQVTQSSRKRIQLIH
jgi:hypothetical protein